MSGQRDDGIIERAIKHAAEKLPSGYEIHICVQLDAGWVELVSPRGSIDIEENPDGIAYTMADAVAAAIADAQESTR